MIIDCISDLHGEYPALEGGDLLIVAGDWTAMDTEKQCFGFFDWVHEQDYLKKIVIAGNHDNRAQKEDYKGPSGVMEGSFTYLCDSGTEFEWFETQDTKWGARHLDGCRHLKVKIWGSPWTKNFEGQNPHCKAFGVDSDEELAAKWALIPEDTDILVTHSPPLGILDKVQNHWSCGVRVGSKSLHNVLYTRKIKPKLHVFGHIHGSYGHIPVMDDMPGCQFVNAAYRDEAYNPVNKPIRIEL